MSCCEIEVRCQGCGECMACQCLSKCSHPFGHYPPDDADRSVLCRAVIQSNTRKAAEMFAEKSVKRAVETLCTALPHQLIGIAMIGLSVVELHMLDQGAAREKSAKTAGMN